MAEPFKIRSLAEPSFLQRVLGRQPTQNAVLEVENELAGATSVKSVQSDALARIAQKYRVNLAVKHRQAFERLYRKAVEQTLRDRRLSEEEIGELRHLKSVLEISDAAATHIHEELTHRVFGKAAAEVVADGVLSSEERQLLDGLALDLKISHRDAARIFESAASEHLQKRLQEAAADERLSPDEDAELEAIARSFGVSLRMDEHSRRVYDRLRLYWLIENGDPPPMNVDIRLQRSEACYAHHQVDWYENRTVTKRYQYGGLTGRIKIAKGIYFRVGDVAVRPVQEDVLKHIDTGNTFLTNKRLIFMGGRKNVTIRLNRILDFTPFRNGVEISKDSGRPVFLGFGDDIDLFSLKLDRALRDIHA